MCVGKGEGSVSQVTFCKGDETNKFQYTKYKYKCCYPEEQKDEIN